MMGTSRRNLQLKIEKETPVNPVVILTMEMPVEPVGVLIKVPVPIAFLVKAAKPKPQTQKTDTKPIGSTKLYANRKSVAKNEPS